jgi:hypothetical protein
MKRYGGVMLLHAFLTSAPDGSEWPAPRAGRFTLKQSPVTIG